MHVTLSTADVAMAVRMVTRAAIVTQVSIGKILDSERLSVDGKD